MSSPRAKYLELQERGAADASRFAGSPLLGLFMRLTAFMGILAGIWLLLFAVWASLPHVRPGHSQIYEMKEEQVAHGLIFPPTEKVRFVIFGNSRVLSSFKPDLFDELSGGRVYSYNLGLPDANRFIDELETLVERGQAPTHVALTIPWSESGRSSILEFLKEDEVVLSTLFPFRHIVRDLAQFAVRSVSHGGPLQYYDYNAALVDRARRHRGYFFIENQSHYEGHRLPEDFRTETDTPHVPRIRDCGHRGPVFERLVELIRREGIHVFMVPSYRRVGQFAPAVMNPDQRRRLAEDGVVAVGPDYWLYPNRLFSDPTHLNPQGADVHTRKLWSLMEPLLLSLEGARASS